jgi:hypothetical protein
MMTATVLLLLTGCAAIIPGEVFLDGPYESAVLEGGPFEDPIGFVSNMRSGQITPLDLKSGRYLSDSLASPFLPPRGIATGDQRQLGPIVPFSPNGDDITVFAVDIASGLLLQAPYILSVSDDIEIVEHTITEPVFVDVDGSGEDVVLEDLAGRDGRTTTEDWTLSYDDGKWWVDGSRSGRQGAPATPYRPYHSDNHEIEFLVSGDATSGDRITFTTDTQLVEHDLGGTVLDVHRLAGQPLLAAAVYDAEADQGWVSLFDMSAGAERGRIDLPAGAQAWRLASGAEVTDLYIADAHRSAAYALSLDLNTPAASTVTEIETAGPLVDLAWVGNESYDNLFVALAGMNRVDVYDLLSGTWKNVNPYDDVDAGLNVHSPVIGMMASDGAIPLQERVEWGSTTGNLIPIEKEIVVLTTLDGALMMLEGDTGCLATTSVGAFTANSDGSGDYTYTGDANPSLSLSPATGEAFHSLPCGGVLLSEDWTVTYDGVQGNWFVEGTRSGVQDARVFEDERYISDDGALSFTILSGTVPSGDGDQYAFSTNSGVLQLTSVDRGIGAIESLEAPAPPVLFTYRSGQQGGGWDQLQEYPYALVPILNSNFVLRVRLDSWVVEIAWD